MSSGPHNFCWEVNLPSYCYFEDSGSFIALNIFILTFKNWSLFFPLPFSPLIPASSLFFFWNPHLRTFFYCSQREREEGWEEGREKNIDVREEHQSVASCMHPDQEWNPKPNGAWGNTLDSNHLSPTGQSYEYSHTMLLADLCFYFSWVNIWEWNCWLIDLHGLLLLIFSFTVCFF